MLPVFFPSRSTSLNLFSSISASTHFRFTHALFASALPVLSGIVSLIFISHVGNFSSREGGGSSLLLLYLFFSDLFPFLFLHYLFFLHPLFLLPFIYFRFLFLFNLSYISTSLSFIPFSSLYISFLSPSFFL